MEPKGTMVSGNFYLILILFLGKTRSEANLAIGKTASQSSNYNDAWVAPNAIDGCTRTNLGSGCCIHTAGGRKQVWWRVDLGELMTIKSIKIYYRAGYIHRLAGYQLYLSNSTGTPPTGALCFEDTSSSANGVQLDVQLTHPCPYAARYVTLYNYRNTTTRYSWYSTNAVFELCEVQVFGCQVGRYGNGDCNSLCSADCYGGNCDSKTGDCFYCQKGKYGNLCGSDCSGDCKDNDCQKDTGFCFECIVGKYGNTCDQTCSSTCKDALCAKDTGYCNECIVGKFGNKCGQTCSSTCKGALCAKDTGDCNECIVGKFGNKCGQTCSSTCKGALCAKDTGYCNECIPGKYGNTCESNCSVSCTNSLCDRNTGNCQECVPGRYGDKCDMTCPANCKDTLCDKVTGNCIECNAGTYGNKCENNCSVNCRDSLCDRDTGNCQECISGKHGDKCGIACPTNCKDMLCSKDTGNCLACIQTKRGEKCELDCPQNCLDGICNKSTASCSGCVAGFYGINCSITCSECADCNQQSGECTNCREGFHGKNCSELCGRCSICELDSGLCQTECDPGYEGSFCKRQTQVPPPPTDTGPIVGAVVGVILAIVIVIVVVIIIRRRRLADSKPDSFDDIGLSDNYSEPLETAETKIENGKTEPRGENFYSNVIVSEEGPDEAPKDTANVYVNAEEVDRKSRTSDSVYYNSGPVGIPVSKLKSIAQTKMQNKAKAFEIEYKSIPSGALHEHNIGMLAQNKPKNRFKTTFPYDHSRVVLDIVGNDVHSDYINANYIDSANSPAEYIATQGPRPGTVNDFWRMIWQLKSGKIVMLTNLVEGTRPKCDKYWPDEGEPLSTTHFNIVLDRERVYAFYVIRDLTVTEKKTKSVRQIHQFHYTTWPDHGTPDPNELVVFHRRVKHYQTVLTGKMVVHCSAGIGRTGTFLALDALLAYGKEFGRIDIMQYIKTMRKDRINMVQTAEQYIAIHHILIEAFDMPDTLIPRMKYHQKYKAISNDGPTNQTKLRKEYQLTQTLKPKYAEDDCKAALLPINKHKNRTLTILAVDKYRAYLRSYASDRTDYINAVAVPSYTSKTGYIVTQTPLKDTVVDMLTMVMDHNCQTIVIIDTDAIEWLPEKDCDKTIGDFTLKHKGKSSTIPNVDLIEVAIQNQTNEFDGVVRVFHLSGWHRDSSVPIDSSWLLQLLELVDSRRKSDDTKATVVMCRDGSSQSGLFCCISNARDQMKIDEEVDIFQVTRQLLVRRPEFLTNFEQYQCSYNMIRDYLDTTDVYMN